MTDTISVLTHPTNKVTKTWRADGAIAPFDDAKYYRLEEKVVTGLGELSALLTRLESAPKSCLVRGRYVGDTLAKARDGAEFKAGRVRKALDYFGDQPLHAVMIDVDGYLSLAWDEVTHPAEAVDEFVKLQLPWQWGGASYHWHLSSSFGHPSKVADGLKVHLWFWLNTPMTSAQLKAYAAGAGLKADLALFNPVQAHFTAGPVFEPGVANPYPARSGFVEGLNSDTVDLDAGDMAQALAAAPAGGGGRGQRMLEVASTDPIVEALAAKGLVKGPAKDGFNIECPFSDEHTGDSGESSTQYRLPHTGGHAVGQFICLHSHCKGRARDEFLSRLGLLDPASGFEAIGVGPDFPPELRREIPKAQHLTTDLANANRIVAKFGRHMIVVAGQWHGWDGRRWRRDDSDVHKQAQALSKIIHAEASEWRAKKATGDDKKTNDAIAEALDKWAARSEMKSTLDNCLAMVKKVHTVDESLIDSDPWLLNCLNGTVDLRTGVVKPHDPADYITKLCPVAYDPQARAPTWEHTLAKVTLEERAPTRPLVAFLQRWFGYCATGSVREQQFVVHYGAGSNGKSTVIDTVAAVLGDYAGAAAPGLLMSKAHESHPTEIADLFARRMVTAHETGEGGVLREDFVKQATGGDRMKARYMRADFFEFAPTHKIQLLTNYKPVIRGQDAGIWRRVLLVPYLARFGSREDVVAGRAHHIKDTTILERLKAEAQGVLTWLVLGARLWFQEGLHAPEAVLAASREYQTEQDRVGQFVHECCEISQDGESVLSGGLEGTIYEAYRAWCLDGGTKPLSKQKFSVELKRAVPSVCVFEAKVEDGFGTRKKVQKVAGILLL